MNKLQELNIIMVAPRGVGKTSLLAAMNEEFDKTFASAGLKTWISDSKTLDAIAECQRLLKNMDRNLNNRADPTAPQLDPWEDQGFLFEVGSGIKKFMKIRFTDPSGEYFKSAASNVQQDYVKQQLNQCDAVIIPIDSTALMEKKTGRARSTEIGSWHEQKNDPARITNLFKESYENVTKPRLVVLAPLKCESYMKTDKDANDLLDHIKIGYRELLDFFKEDKHYHKIAVVITPVQTIGHTVFSHAETSDNYTQFVYNKQPIDAPYAPKDGDQPLRYVLRFLLNVYNEDRKLELEKARENLDKVEKEVGFKAYQLNSAQRRLELAQQRFNERNQLWRPFRGIANFFDDVYTPYSEANNSYTETESAFNETENQKFAIQGMVDATEAQIQAFNTAISKFAVDCKEDRGFAIFQGRAKWLPVPK